MEILIEKEKYYKIKRNKNVLVGKCLEVSPRKCKFLIVFDKDKVLEKQTKWFGVKDVETITKILDSNVVLELLK